MKPNNPKDQKELSKDLKSESSKPDTSRQESVDNQDELRSIDEKMLNDITLIPTIFGGGECHEEG